ncbi:adenosylcobinamide-phosphate synthase CbiB [Paenactinomyces guangxiensis]|uniref:Cobalamin biosynthesis protein CobD n=1 Tax=Paenactinomyces guangxiensis TaxID=1490290 RepID=A0A7W1WN17_9BACL|nr:adenosylcobinamide-phosphate synthase CbiB [Paenactinomyces guangxiensis]MBA4492806.1 cobalamin biosynthesis protein CobD [Paenactinomyces guangxiensis]MBH8590345.1 cobalamin biosynthesis protein CobD [Paenactinomyces guangxiensis]
MEVAWIIFAAYLLDLLIGDPRWLPHPVVGIGRCISGFEKGLLSLIRRQRWKNESHPVQIRLLGILFPLLIAGSTYLLVFFITQLVYDWNVWAGRLLEIWIISTTIATKGLAEAGKKIYEKLISGNIRQARAALSMVVGRDTEKLDEEEIVRGGVETVAENIVDAAVSPLFYAALGGAPLAMAYRAINTLDSMVGYRNQKYLHLGWASARLDDLANWIPARLAIIPMLGALVLLQLHPRTAFHIYRRDASLHPSPNSGIPEALMAGGLHIQLGGVNTYQGQPSNRATMGEPVEPKKPSHLLQAIRVLHLTSAIYISILMPVTFLIQVLFAYV